MSEREFIHDIINPVCGIQLIVASILADIESGEPVYDLNERLEHIRRAVAKLDLLLKQGPRPTKQSA